jgi:uncharacterized protein YndB with AHSA1/START domain
MARVVEHEVEYPHAPEKVWRAITDPAQIAQWFPGAWGETSTDFQPVVGARFRMDAEKKRGWRGYVEGTVLEVDPPRRLVYTWSGTPQEDAEPTRVEWTLDPTPKGTRLRLVYTQTGFSGVMGFLAYHGARASWRKMMDESLPALFADAPPAVR